MEETKRHDFLLGLCITLGTIVIGLISYVVYFNTISQQKARCNYSGWSYADGETFKSSDGCNYCACSDGKTVCTLMACEGSN
jgi:hypothetical protein